MAHLEEVAHVALMRGWSIKRPLPFARRRRALG